METLMGNRERKSCHRLHVQIALPGRFRAYITRQRKLVSRVWLDIGLPRYSGRSCQWRESWGWWYNFGNWKPLTEVTSRILQRFLDKLPQMGYIIYEPWWVRTPSINESRLLESLYKILVFEDSNEDDNTPLQLLQSWSPVPRFDSIRHADPAVGTALAY